MNNNSNINKSLNNFNEFKIIASFAPLNIKNKSNKNNMVSSIMLYKNIIDFNKIEELSLFLSKKTDYFNKMKFLIINLGIYNNIAGDIINKTQNLKILDINIITIFKLLSEYVQKNKSNNNKNNNKIFNSNYFLDINNFLKISILNKYLKDDINYKNYINDFNVIFIFNDIT